jgi:ribose transport system permease protein
MQRLLPFATLLILFVFLAVASPHFRTAGNLSGIVRQTSVINIMALGMTLVMIAGGIDLSVGSQLAFCSLMGTMAMEQGAPVPVAVLAAASAGVLLGSLNGFFTTWLRITPFIVTLGTLGIIRGVTLIISRGLPVERLPANFAVLRQGNVGPLPVPLLILTVAAVLMHFLLRRTRLGRYAYAMGSNAEAARYAGVPLGVYTVAVYALAGLLTGVASMIEASGLMSGQPTAGEGYELRVIAAVVIGGGSLRGGEGTVTGTLVGGFIMGLLANGADMLHVSAFWQQVLIGAVIIAAVGIDEWRKRRAE